MNIEINRHLMGLDAYVPGEQPTEPGWVKLNTNENPYPPAPEVIEVFHSFAPDRARLYPPPDCATLRSAIGETLDWPPEGILITNGSDEGLRLIAHSYLNAGDRVGMFRPTYSYYPILAQMFGAAISASNVGRRGEWPGPLDFDGVKLFFLANPNPPYGTFHTPDQIAEMVASHPGVLFAIDEAYVEFADRDCLSLLRRFSNLFLLRTFSKSHALAGLRVGFVLGRSEHMVPLRVVRDSYNVNAMSQMAAVAAWQARGYYRARMAEVVQTREATRMRLSDLGFDVLPSQANFLFARHGKAPQLFQQLKERRILVRYFDAPTTRDGLRITVGTPEQMDTLILALSNLLEQKRPRRDS